jgi:uncharacterized coiled-coil protein SlyX
MTDELIARLRDYDRCTVGPQEAADALEERGKRIDELESRLIYKEARITELESIIAVNRLVKTRIAALEAALKQSNDTLHELTAIIPGNDKGALDAIANAMRTARAAYLGEKE